MKRPLIRQFDYSTIRLFAALALCAASAVASAMPLGLRLTQQAAAAKGAAEKDPLLLTEEEAYERYAPDTAFVIDLALAGTNEVSITPACLQFGRDYSNVSIDWGDGETSSGTAVYYGTTYSHTYAKQDVYVVRIGDRVACPNYEYSDSFRLSVVRILRHADTRTLYRGGFNNMTNLRALADGKLPRWPKSPLTTSLTTGYSGCTSLDATEFPEWPSGLTSIGRDIYYNTKITATKFPEWPSGLTSICDRWGGVYACSYVTATEIPEWPKGVTTMGPVYMQCSGIRLTRIPDWPEGLKEIDEGYNYSFFPGGTVSVTNLPAWPEGLEKCNGVFGGYNSGGNPGIKCGVLKWPSGLKEAVKTYNGCSGLTGSVPAWGDKITNANATFQNCKGLTGEIPKWGAAITDVRSCYGGCSGLTGAWTSDPAELMPTNITSHAGCVSGASSDLRALFYSDWGGSRPKEE